MGEPVARRRAAWVADLASSDMGHRSVDCFMIVGSDGRKNSPGGGRRGAISPVLGPWINISTELGLFWKIECPTERRPLPRAF